MKTLRQSFGVELVITKIRVQKLKVKETKGAIAGISKTESSSPRETPARCSTGSFFTNEVAGSWKSSTLASVRPAGIFPLSPMHKHTTHTHTEILTKKQQNRKGQKETKAGKKLGMTWSNRPFHFVLETTRSESIEFFSEFSAIL